MVCIFSSYLITLLNVINNRSEPLAFPGKVNCFSQPRLRLWFRSTDYTNFFVFWRLKNPSLQIKPPTTLNHLFFHSTIILPYCNRMDRRCSWAFVILTVASLGCGEIFVPSSPTACAIPDAAVTDTVQCISQVITIPKSGTITAIRVGFQITHPYASDVFVALLPPGKYFRLII